MFFIRYRINWISNGGYGEYSRRNRHGDPIFSNIEDANAVIGALRTNAEKCDLNYTFWASPHFAIKKGKKILGS